MSTNVFEHAVILQVSFSCLGNSRRISSEPVETDADKAWLRLSKSLVESEELNAVRSLANRICRHFANMGLPFPLRSGHFLIPLRRLDQAVEQLQEFDQVWQESVSVFIAAYPGLVDQARDKLGSLFVATDYPPVNDLPHRFRFVWQFIEFSVPGSLGTVSKALLAAEQKKAAEQVAQITLDIQTMLRTEFAARLTRLRERLQGVDDGTTKRLTSATLQRVQTWLEEFREGRNIADDADLADLTDELAGALSGIESANLRDDEGLRGYVTQQCIDIEKSLAALIDSNGRGRVYNFQEGGGVDDL